MGTVKQLLDIARGTIGIKENPPDSNKVSFNTWYYGSEVSGPKYPWCQVYVQYCCAKAGVKLPIKTASCSALMNSAKSAGMWITSDFKPGDITIYDFYGSRRNASHCGIVEEVLPDYGVRAIEGNTSISGSQSNGGMVCRKDRHNKFIIGVVRPVFDEDKEEEDIMTGLEILNALTDEQAYNLLMKAQRHAATLPEPDWSKGEGHWQRATAAGVVNGESPEGLLKRDEVAAILGRKGLL